MVFDKCVFLGANAAGQPNTYTTPPELDIAIKNAINVSLTAEITGVGAACSAPTGPSIAVECAVAATDLPAAYKHIGYVVEHVERKRYTASIVFVENNANLGSYYARGFLRLKFTNTDAVNPAFIRVRLWADLESADGGHAEVVTRDADPSAMAGAPFLWSDEVLYLDPTGATGATHWTMSAADTLPMRDRTFASYTVDYAVLGAGTAEVDFERTVMPTEIDAAWQAMNPAPVALTGPSGYITRSFAADGTTSLAPCGYQRVHFRNTHAAQWIAIRARTWAHCTGT